MCNLSCMCCCMYVYCMSGLMDARVTYICGYVNRCWTSARLIERPRERCWRAITKNTHSYFTWWNLKWMGCGRLCCDMQRRIEIKKKHTHTITHSSLEIGSVPGRISRAWGAFYCNTIKYTIVYCHTRAPAPNNRVHLCYKLYFWSMPPCRQPSLAGLLIRSDNRRRCETNIVSLTQRRATFTTMICA